MPDSTDQSDHLSDKKYPCMEMLQLILDGGATPAQQIEWKEHIDACMPCYKSYNLELALKALLKSKCSGNGAPADLVEKIKTKISKNLPH